MAKHRKAPPEEFYSAGDNSAANELTTVPRTMRRKGFARLEPPLPDDAYEAALLRPKGSKSNCDRRLLGLHLYRI
ncbi:hypothetical protein QA633_07515 [Bradyrhizobium barranii]|uniref:hypothetical protein n=1 Tax=Bradyrhizobium TaxID=374 RepID=UPI0024B041FF|nr:hypothetical protein [Bradyrhizobium barranii]WFT96911.1 hypothetical protein QA633_07515 [Bradyrhizobium barranii]